MHVINTFVSLNSTISMLMDSHKPLETLNALKLLKTAPLCAQVHKVTPNENLSTPRLWNTCNTSMQVPNHLDQTIDPPLEPQHLTNHLYDHKCIKLNETTFHLQKRLGMKNLEIQRKRSTKKSAPTCNFSPCTPPREKTPPKRSKMLPKAPNQPLPQRPRTNCLNAIKDSCNTHEWAHNLLKVRDESTRHTHTQGMRRKRWSLLKGLPP
jgi:hypothetical protein